MNLYNRWPFVSGLFPSACFWVHSCHSMFSVLLLFIAESVLTFNIGSTDVTGKWVGSKNGFQPLQICHLLSPIPQRCPKSSFPQGIHRGWVLWPPSQAAGRTCLHPVSDDYATKWLENCPSRRQQLRFQQVNNILEVHISESTVMHLPLNLGVWGKAWLLMGRPRNGLCNCHSWRWHWQGAGVLPGFSGCESNVLLESGSTHRWNWVDCVRADGEAFSWKLCFLMLI